jgi:hypothetical protein
LNLDDLKNQRATVVARGQESVNEQLRLEGELRRLDILIEVIMQNGESVPVTVTPTPENADGTATAD